MDRVQVLQDALTKANQALSDALVELASTRQKLINLPVVPQVSINIAQEEAKDKEIQTLIDDTNKKADSVGISIELTAQVVATPVDVAPVIDVPVIQV